MSDLTPTERSRVKRLHERGAYDLDTIASILDVGVLCHVGYVIDGQPYVTPTAYWRRGRTEETFRQWKRELAEAEASA